ncbi:hypothetical protein QE152_g7788 [Popillia japonica]|uniref:Uncharacterized protein n=1 Tax=Popillia japonica TaxID=7064 RepID=A0AAW1M848_POPJA
MRMGAKKHNAQHLYPSYDRIREAKKRCYPSNILVDNFGASVPLQHLLDHTYSRLAEIIEISDELIQAEHIKINLICKYGCDGSSGHNEYNRIPARNIETEESEEDEDCQNLSDANLFLFSLVPLRLVANLNNSEAVLLWENSKPSSTHFCRPIKFKYMKETANNSEAVLLWENSKPSSTHFCRPIKFKYMKETAIIAKQYFYGKTASHPPLIFVVLLNLNT